jgi:hypothetical protein
LNIRIVTGVLTTLVFVGIGVNLLSDPASQRIGAVLAGLGVLRGGFLFKQWNDARGSDDPEAP